MEENSPKTASAIARRLKPLNVLADGQILINEIFASVQGESSYAGLPCTFIRTAVCNLRCGYCDTAYAFGRGDKFEVGEIIDRVEALGIELVEITGGEPLLQAPVLPLMKSLCDSGYTVMLETSGSLDVSAVDERVIRIIDLKTPSSGELEANHMGNLDILRPSDELKFVLGDREDYLWARKLIQRRNLAEKATLLMGVVYDTVAAHDVVRWILEDKLPVRFQIQMHKVIWDPDLAGV